MPQPVKFYNAKPKETTTEETAVPVIKLPTLTHDQLHDALFFAQDILERSSIPFMVLGETAKCIIDNELPNLTGDKVEVGVTKRHLTRSCLETLKSLVKCTVDNDIKFDYHGVPVEVKVIEGNYSYFTNPDVRYYHVTEFKTPNPFPEYWENRDNIQ